MSRLARPGEAAASVATVALAAIALTTATGNGRALGAVFALALLWAAMPLIGHLLTRRDVAPVEGAEPSTPVLGSFTTIVRLGQEPLDIARTTILLSVAEGPTRVIAPIGCAPIELRRLGADVVEAPTFASGLRHTLTTIDTDAVLFTSARAVPVASACNAAAAALSDSVGWVVGRTRPFTADGYVLDAREPVSSVLRSDARRSGVTLWEPDVTLVRTDLLRQHAVEPHRPFGRWLRHQSRAGLRGLEVDTELVRRAAPVDASAYWPDTVSRQWGRVADLTGALACGSLRARIIAVGLLARELFAVPALVWATLPIAAGSASGLPYARSWTVCLASVLAVAACRYTALHAATGRRPRPVHDAVAALHTVPGSLAALGAVVTRRLPSRRMHLPSRPLVWAALALTLVTGYRLVSSSSVSRSPFTIGLSLGALGMLWLFSMSALAQRNWARSTYRVPLALDALVDGLPFRTVNGSPSGLAVTGPAALSTPLGSRVPIELRLDDGTSVLSTGQVTATRTVGETPVLGLALEFPEGVRRQWIGQLSRSADATHDAGAQPPSGLDTVDAGPARETRRRFADRLVIGLVGAVSIGLGSLLLLLLLGYRPLVIRSGSMVPTLEIGDVVLSEEVPVSALRVGDIANLPTPNSDGTGTLTHRIVAVERRGDELLVSTQGDANASGESTLIAPDRLAGRARWTIPWIGRPATAVRTSSSSMWIGVGALGAILLAVTVRPRRRDAATGA